MLLCDGRHIIKDETAQVHGQAEQGIEGCGLGKRAHHVAAPADEDSVEQRKRRKSRFADGRAASVVIRASRATVAPRRSRYPGRHRTLRFGHMNAAVAPGARPLLVEIDRDNRRRFDFIGIAPFDLFHRLAVSAKRGCRRGKSLLVRSTPERLQSGACKLVRGAVDSVFRPVGRNIPLRCEGGSRMHKLVGVARFRVPDRSAADAADLPPVRRLADCHHRTWRRTGRQSASANHGASDFAKTLPPIR